MDDSKSKITICSHNINGFSSKKSYLYSQCDATTDLIYGVQEHWLAPPYKKQFGVNRLRTVHPDFDGFGSSAMKRDVETKVRKGRPYGGTGFIYHKKFSNCIKPMLNYNHDRVSVMKLSEKDGDIIVINAYLPYFKTSDLMNQTALFRETVGYIANIIRENSTCRFVLLMDMNCNIYDTHHPFSMIIRELMSDNDLVSAFDYSADFNPATSYTRCDVKTGSYTLIDGILFSRSLANLVSNVRIVNDGENTSDHLPVRLDIELYISKIDIERKKHTPVIQWGKLSLDSLETYQRAMADKLDSINVPFHVLLHGDRCCSDNNHKSIIESYYRQIVNAVCYADGLLPRTVPSSQRPFWSNELNDLKKSSIDCVEYWKRNGSPRYGPIFECKKSCTNRYKSAIRKARRNDNQRVNDSLYSDLLDRDHNQFWRTFRNCSKVSDSLVTRIDGETNPNGVAQAFKTHFENVYSGGDSPAHNKLKDEFHALFTDYENERVFDSLSPFYLTWSDMLNVISKIKPGKSSAGFIKPEHLFHGSEKLAVHLHLMFNSMIQHGFVVNDFLHGEITPIIKDSQGDTSDSSNYRGINVGCLFSKMFEIAINDKIEPLLHSDDLQFGFKKRTSTAHALYVLRSTVDYFTSRKSSVYATFLDCSKAFDRVSHYGIFIKLMERRIPLCFLLIIMFWHLNMTCHVKWGEARSKSFPVPLGTKQGGIISPKLFSLYINGLISILRNSGLGCHIIDRFIGCILFADDLVILSPTRSAMQKLIDLCVQYCDKFCLSFNVKKSHVMTFGKFDTIPKPLQLNGTVIGDVKEFKYLGTTIVAGPTLSFSAQSELLSFYRASNSVLNVLSGAHKRVLMSLLYSNCVPVLTFNSSVKQFSSSQMSDCNIAINSAIRKIFGYQRWESVRHLREEYGHKSIYELFKTAEIRFLTLCEVHCNPIVRFLLTCHS